MSDSNSELADRFSQLSNEELVYMIEVQFKDYTEEALNIASSEAEKRGGLSGLQVKLEKERRAKEQKEHKLAKRQPKQAKLKEQTVVVDSSISDYGAARIICKIISFLGWLMVISGVIVIFVGIGQGNRHGGVSLVLVLTGLGISMSGLFFVVSGQITRATVDSASHTKEILKIMREKS